MVTEVSEEQTVKAWLPMLVTLSGIVMDTRDSQPEKANSSMHVTPSEMLTEVRE